MAVSFRVSKVSISSTNETQRIMLKAKPKNKVEHPETLRFWDWDFGEERFVESYSHVFFYYGKFISLDLHKLDAWKKFQNYSPKWWFNGDDP